MEELICLSCPKYNELDEEEMEFTTEKVRICKHIERYRRMSDHAYLCKEAELQVNQACHEGYGIVIDERKIEETTLAGSSDISGTYSSVDSYKEMLSDIVQEKDARTMANFHFIRDFIPKTKNDLIFKLYLSGVFFGGTIDKIAFTLGIPTTNLKRIVEKYKIKDSK